ncbi:unnamed protein product [Clavelina lepadiformis]|uniref:Poly [ADP-ribose] polymerase n=1 Tax=Clavelina lepadiformis TaxID=159417 RepID=A0ABP0FF47_CLALP
MTYHLKHISFLVGEEEKIFAKEPDFVFEVVYSKPEEVRFEQIRNDRDLLYAYHGSKTENFHSILRTGLRNNLNKVSLFGEGIYLSRDMRVCMNYSPISAGWQNSLLGTSLSCIAVCEIIDHPDVKCSVKRSLQNLHSEELRQRRRSTNLATEAQGADDDTHEVKTLKTEKRRSYIKGSEGGQIPEKYYVVRNDDHVRVKYLIVHAPYADKTFIRELTSV